MPTESGRSRWDFEALTSELVGIGLTEAQARELLAPWQRADAAGVPMEVIFMAYIDAAKEIARRAAGTHRASMEKVIEDGLAAFEERDARGGVEP